MLKNLKKHQKQAKSSSFSVAMATITTPSNIFLLIMIDLDYTIILICYMTWFDDFLVIKMLKNLKKRQKMLTLATLTVSMATNGFLAENMKVPTCRACPRVLLVKFLWKSLERSQSYSKKTRFAGFRGGSPNFISVRLDTGRDSLRSTLFLRVKTQTSCTGRATPQGEQGRWLPTRSLSLHRSSVSRFANLSFTRSFMVIIVSNSSDGVSRKCTHLDEKWN